MVTILTLNLCLFLRILFEYLAIGMESKQLPNENIRASSWKGQQAPYFARLNRKYSGWLPENSLESPQWLQVELNKDELLTHVAIQGNLPSTIYSYLKSYVLHHRRSNGAFVIYRQTGKEKVGDYFNFFPQDCVHTMPARENNGSLSCVHTKPLKFVGY